MLSWLAPPTRSPFRTPMSRLGALHGPGGGVIVLTNHGSLRADVPVTVPEGAVLQTVVKDGPTEPVAAKDFGLAIDGHAGAIVLWRSEEAERRA